MLCICVPRSPTEISAFLRSACLWPRTAGRQQCRGAQRAFRSLCGFSFLEACSQPPSGLRAQSVSSPRPWSHTIKRLQSFSDARPLLSYSRVLFRTFGLVKGIVPRVS